ncbi:MAG: late competence development ComFB family protein [Spirochaetaceae bacterium]|nr:late competence development ComFB family protein [Spirochaetaceae bacterium]
MEIHNLVEELVFAEVEAACDSINNLNKNDDLCTCRQCRLDTACYVLNRLKPHYVVSSRGIMREEQLDINKQQQLADIASLVYRGIKHVNLNRRPGFKHMREDRAVNAPSVACFNLPVIIGRLLNGRTFEPASGIAVELYVDGLLAEMKDANWQNPCVLSEKTEGTYTFWPASVPSGRNCKKRLFHFSIKAQPAGSAPLIHHFELPVFSEKKPIYAVNLNRTHKISDLYLFDTAEDDEPPCLNRCGTLQALPVDEAPQQRP